MNNVLFIKFKEKVLFKEKGYYSTEFENVY